MKTSFPKSKIRVVLLEGIHARGRERLVEEGFTVDASARALEGEALAAAIKAGGGAHALGIRSKSGVTAGVIAPASRLLAIGCFCIGTDQVDLKAACLAGIPVFNSPFSNTRSVAELTICEIIALHRRLSDRSTQMHRGEWDKSASGAHEVRGRTLGIVGYGRIGSQVSVLAEALGMRVIYFDVRAVLPLGNARPVRTLKELLAGSDVVTVHVPDTDRTRGLIGRDELGAMKRGAHLINNARGGVVDVPALARAIRDGRLGGAAADVFPSEPAGKGDAFASELRGLENVILTPHIGGSTEEAQEAIAEDVAAKLARFINNGSTAGAVNVPEVDLPEQGMAESRGKAGGRKAERRHRILHFHRNVPGVLSKMHAAIAALGANIAAEYLQTNADIGYVVLDVDPTDARAIVERLREIPETIRVRLLW
ncbi:MAG: phosphoglycerate dehydrogenase [Phycisphaeraceae bacterium]|nr:phosphoglycerate dehydrogenase [Phycisphaeraceae bacterium]